MANLCRNRKDPRPFSVEYEVGSEVGIQTEKGIIYGRINSIDGGNWIYVSWRRPAGFHDFLPGYCRPDQVFAAVKKFKPETHGKDFSE